jgi:carboxyl-terminal processing protease
MASAVRAEPGLDASTRQKAFERVWLRVKEVHYDANFNGVDWDAVRQRYAPKVASAKTDAAFYELLSKMLGELKQSHYAIVPPDTSGMENENMARGDGETGMVVQLVEGEAVITRIEPDSPADKAGLRPGFVLTHIENRPVKKIIETVRARKPSVVRERLYTMLALEARLSGMPGSALTLRFRDGENKTRIVKLTRRAAKGEITQFGEMPAVRVFVESRRLEDNIGYLRFNLFMLPLLEPLKAAIREMKDAPGIIIDLRGNHGGVGAMASSLAGLFYDQRSALGTMKMRRGEINFVVYPQPEPFLKPLVLLTDEASLSTSEIMAGSLQENQRAITVGRPTGGMVLPSQFERLPGGARFQYAVADFKTPKGVLLEGRGVVPDVPVELTRRSLLSGKDPILSTAIAVIRKSQSNAASKENK